jgi:Spy/CpxP family protein refolding chaperone
MKKQILTTLLLAIFACLSFTADAQRARGKAQDGNPFHVIEQLKQELKLTQEQEKQMEALRKSFRKEAVAMYTPLGHNK